MMQSSKYQIAKRIKKQFVISTRHTQFSEYGNGIDLCITFSIFISFSYLPW